MREGNILSGVRIYVSFNYQVFVDFNLELETGKLI